MFFHVIFELLEILIEEKTVVIFIKSQRLRWAAAHVIRMDTIGTVKKTN